MKKQHKSDLIRKAFEEFADAHIGDTLYTWQINKGVSEMVEGGLSGWCASDFAARESKQPRSKRNLTLFRRENRGEYTVLSKEDRK